MNDPAERLAAAGGDLLALREPLEAGEPWPLSAAYGTEPEANWGAREVLAHVNEMLPYWTEQLAGVVAGDPATAVPFGRVATDPGRIGRIGADRRQTVHSLLDGIERGLAAATAFLGGLSAADLERRGLHQTRGELTVGESVERFLTNHLEEHVEQLRKILGGPPAA
jgi:hypothetical protein